MLVSLRSAFSARYVTIGFVAVAVHLIAWPAEQASAQELFEFLFGGVRRAPAPPPQALSYAPPAAPVTRMPSTQPSTGAGRSASYCVRLCDGRFFPIQRHSAANPVQLCNAFCPASRTKIFSGSDVAHAVAADGTRYAGLKNALGYRNRLVPDCTCNGKDSFGLAPVDPNTDPTLRPGDILATASGLVMVTGTGSSHIAAHATVFLHPTESRR